MRVYWRLGSGRSARVVDAQQILGCTDWRNGSDLDDLACAGSRAALKTERKEPDLARDFNGQ